jgi:pimeloyl-ACP methyl ester carboxylesterase
MEPFRIDVPQAELDDLHDRLVRTRWPSPLDGVGWEWGTDPAYLRELVGYWADGYDWRAQEAALNRVEHGRVEVRGRRVHVVRVAPRGDDPAGIPVLLLHGWPGSFVQMLDLARLLADPGPGRVAHPVVVGSLPGFGFSDPATEPGMNESGMADALDEAMAALGVDRYLAHGTDFGAGVASELALQHPEHLVGIHIGGSSPHADGITEADPPVLRRYAADVARWRAAEVGYAAIQGTRPQSLAPALADSPAGLAAWIVEKLRRWSDCGGDVERRFSKDQLLTNVMIYWITNSIGSSIRAYREPAPATDLRASAVPVAHLMSDRDMFPTPREWIERTSRIDRWTRVDRGGHFIEWEEPGLVADDIRAFAAELA